MKVAILLIGLCVAFVMAAPAPIFDREKRVIPPSVITPSNGPFDITAPNNAPPSSTDIPISKVPTPVNPFDNNPPGGAQTSNVPPNDVPVSNVPPPINPFDITLPPSGELPPGPNITATINVPGIDDGFLTANVIACDGPQFTNTCVRVVAPLGQCVSGPAGTRADGTTSSVQIAGDLLCTFFSSAECPFGQAIGTFRSPGISDLSVTQYDNTIRSFFCVEPEVGP